jgi:hypothetical protein
MARSDDIRDLIRRFDEHLERQSTLMERNDRTIERNTQAMERNTRAWGHTVAAMSAIRNHLEDMRGEIRAQTEAIWPMIDRIDGGQQQA